MCLCIRPSLIINVILLSANLSEQRAKLKKMEASLARRKAEVASLRNIVEKSYRLSLDSVAQEHESTLLQLDQEIKENRREQSDTREKLKDMQKAAAEGAALEIEFDKEVRRCNDLNCVMF